MVFMSAATALKNTAGRSHRQRLLLVLAYILAIVSGVILIATAVAAFSISVAARASIRKNAKQPLLFTAFVLGLWKWALLLFLLWTTFLIFHFYTDWQLGSTGVVIALIINIIAALLVNTWQSYRSVSWNITHEALDKNISQEGEQRTKFNEQHNFLIGDRESKRRMALSKILSSGSSRAGDSSG